MSLSVYRRLSALVNFAFLLVSRLDYKPPEGTREDLDGFKTWRFNLQENNLPTLFGIEVTITAASSFQGWANYFEWLRPYNIQHRQWVLVNSFLSAPRTFCKQYKLTPWSIIILIIYINICQTDCDPGCISLVSYKLGCTYASVSPDPLYRANHGKSVREVDLRVAPVWELQ